MSLKDMDTPMLRDEYRKLQLCAELVGTPPSTFNSIVREELSNLKLAPEARNWVACGDEVLNRLVKEEEFIFELRAAR